jgi:hypothetical protein
LNDTLRLIIRTVKSILRISLAPERRALAGLTAASLLVALLDVVGVAAMLPVMLAALQPDFIERYSAMASIARWTGVSDPSLLILMMVVGLLIFFIVKNVVALYVIGMQAKFSYSICTRLSRNLMSY